MATIEEISTAFYNYSFEKFEEEVNHSDKPSEKSFPTQSEFSQSFQDKINAVYNDLNRNYPPEQANYIYRTFIANLNKQSQNPGQSKIVNSSRGTINVENLQSYSKKVQETLKARHPEKFETVNNKETEIKSENKVVDFSNPKEKKEFVQFAKGFNELEIGTKEYDNYMNNFWGEEQYKNASAEDKAKMHIINKELSGFMEYYSDRLEENPNLDYDEALNGYCEQNPNEDKENLKNAMKIAQNRYRYQMLESQLKELEQNEVIESKGLSEEKKKLLKDMKQLDAELDTLLEGHNYDKDELDNLIKVIEENEKGKDRNGDNEFENFNRNEEVIEEEKNLQNLFSANDEEIEQDEELDDLFSADNEEIEQGEESKDLLSENNAEIEPSEQIEKVIIDNNKQPIQQDKQVFVNPILTGVDENDLKQEDYTMEIDEKKGVWNRIKNTFSKIKDVVVKRLNLNQNKTLKGQELIGTAENNSPSTDDKRENTNSWELSQYGVTQEEVLENTQNAIDNSKKDKSNDSSNIQVASDQEINI